MRPEKGRYYQNGRSRYFLLSLSALENIGIPATLGFYFNRGNMVHLKTKIGFDSGLVVFLFVMKHSFSIGTRTLVYLL